MDYYFHPFGKALQRMKSEDKILKLIEHNQPLGGVGLQRKSSQSASISLTIGRLKQHANISNVDMVYMG
jgi:hypothetical protein